MEPIITNKKGSASIEFVWSMIVFVVVMMTVFRFFSMTMQSSGRLVRSRHSAFSLLDQNRRGFIYTDDASGANAGNKYKTTQGCSNDCENKLDFNSAGSIDQNFVIYLQPK